MKYKNEIVYENNGFIVKSRTLVIDEEEANERAINFRNILMELVQKAPSSQI